MKTINDYADLVKEQHALNTTIAPVETDLTSASKAYAVGQKFIYDGVLYQAKTAIAQGAALVLNTNYEASDDVSSEIQTLTKQVEGAWYKGRNLFNTATTSEGYIRDNNGEFVEHSNSIATDFIRITSGEQYTITSEQSGSKWGAWYNASKQFISGFNGFDNLVAPSNAVYMRVTLNYENNNPNWATTAQIEPGDTATPYAPYAMTNRELTQDADFFRNGRETASADRVTDLDTLLTGNSTHSFSIKCVASSATNAPSTGEGMVLTQ